MKANVDRKVKLEPLVEMFALNIKMDILKLKMYLGTISVPFIKSVVTRIIWVVTGKRDVSGKDVSSCSELKVLNIEPVPVSLLQDV